MKLKITPAETVALNELVAYIRQPTDDRKVLLGLVDLPEGWLATRIKMAQSIDIRLEVRAELEGKLSISAVLPNDIVACDECNSLQVYSYVYDPGDADNGVSERCNVPLCADCGARFWGDVQERKFALPVEAK